MRAQLVQPGLRPRQPLLQAAPGDHLGGQPGLAALLLARLTPGSGRRGELAEQLGDQARPQIGFGVMPGVEPHLADRPMSQAIIGIDCWLGPAPGSEAAQEVALAFPPVAEQPDRQRRPR